MVILSLRVYNPSQEQLALAKTLEALSPKKPEALRSNRRASMKTQ
jgi:hypothetical protein